MSATQMALISMSFDSKILAKHKRGASFLKSKSNTCPFPRPTWRLDLGKHGHVKAKVFEKSKRSDAFKSSFRVQLNILALFYLKYFNFDVSFV